ncbi:MAG: hypothetical protein L0Y44_11635 [Phycisphaerales bacterium]|nr:hypothetical protein [Phycisphaerales bacterium]MCI0631291.1 hypothetical protein [Phycisphaerales bacterium]MCI0677316.1 hypothetical protein [Phycisphaerales bacterium]
MTQQDPFQLTPNPYAPAPESALQYPSYAVQPTLKHSGLGIASFIISMVVGLGEIAAVIFVGVMETSNPGGVADDSPMAAMLGLSMCGGALLALVGAVLGLIGAVLRDRRKVFAILGLAFNACIIVGIIGLMIIGMAAAGP